MGRRPIALSPKVTAEIAARTARGESAATIHAAVPGAPSIETIKRRQRELRGGRAMKPAEASPAPAPAPARADRDDEHGALLGAYANAGDQAEARATAVALRRYEHPEFGRLLDAGSTVVAALLGSEPEIGDLLSTPEAVATLAMAATDFFGAVEPHASGAAVTAARQRAYDLLADALEIVGKP
jgi:hypothetical protein